MLPDHRIPSVFPSDKTLTSPKETVKLRDRRWADNNGWVKTETEADARAKMLIYLIENKLINLPLQAE